MAEQLDDSFIRNLPEYKRVKAGYFIPMDDMDDLKTYRLDLKELLISATTGNFEWITDNDPGYAEFAVVTWNGSWFQSLIDNNLNITPGTDAAAWVELTKSPSGLAPWEAGVYSQDDVFVLWNDGTDLAPDWKIYFLFDSTRPYVSTDFEAERTAGDWLPLTGGVSQFRGDFTPGGSDDYPSSGGSGAAGVIVVGDEWRLPTGGTYDGDAWPNNTLLKNIAASTWRLY